MKVIDPSTRLFERPARVLLNSFLLVVTLSAISGCAIPVQGESGSMHYIVIGIGVVSTPPRETKDDVLVTKAEALGIMISDQPGTKFAIGYTKSSLIAVPEKREDVIVEVSQKLFGPLSVIVNSPRQEGGIYVQQTAE